MVPRVAAFAVAGIGPNLAQPIGELDVCEVNILDLALRRVALVTKDQRRNMRQLSGIWGENIGFVRGNLFCLFRIPVELDLVPIKRPSPLDLLRDSWFCQGCLPVNTATTAIRLPGRKKRSADTKMTSNPPDSRGSSRKER